MKSVPSQGQIFQMNCDFNRCNDAWL